MSAADWGPKVAGRWLEGDWKVTQREFQIEAKEVAPSAGTLKRPAVFIKDPALGPTPSSHAAESS